MRVHEVHVRDLLAWRLAKCKIVHGGGTQHKTQEPLLVWRLAAGATCRAGALGNPVLDRIQEAVAFFISALLGLRLRLFLLAIGVIFLCILFLTLRVLALPRAL